MSVFISNENIETVKFCLTAVKSDYHTDIVLREKIDKILASFVSQDTNTAKNFIIEKIKELSTKYPDVKFTYKFVLFDFDTTHYVGVSDVDLYESNNYIDNEFIINKSFDEKFPSQILLFVNPESLNWFTDCEFVIKNGEIK